MFKFSPSLQYIYMICFWLGFFNICNIALFIMHGAYDKWTWAYSHKPVFDFLIVSNKSALCLLQARLAHPTSWVCCHEIYFPCSISYIICQLSWAHNFKYWLLARNARLLILMNQQMTVPHPLCLPRQCHPVVHASCTRYSTHKHKRPANCTSGGFECNYHEYPDGRVPGMV